MDSQVRGVIALVRAALTGEGQPLPADFDLEQAYEPIVQHNIAVMALEGAVLCGLDKKLPVMQKLFVRAFRDIGRVEAQDRASEKLFAAFEEAGMDFMPVKGALLRGLYPKREYRSMGDMDVLIRLEQYEKIRPILLGQGYDIVDEKDDHCFVWRNQAFLLELHKYLIPLRNKDYYAYFGTGWNLAVPTNTSRFAMSDEYQYIYVFTHLAKHYRDGGVGIRQMCDLWLLRKALPKLDENCVRAELEKLKLLEFYDHIRRTLHCWFEGGEGDEMVGFISEVIYESGAFGQPSAKTLSDGARLAGEKRANDMLGCKNMLMHIFPSMMAMKKLFPILEKAPVLLPVMWVYRGVRILTLERYKITRVKKTSQAYGREAVSAHQEALEYVGLKFRNK